MGILVALVVLTALLGLFVAVGLAAGARNADGSSDAAPALDGQVNAPADAPAKPAGQLIRLLRSAILIDAAVVAMIVVGACLFSTSSVETFGGETSGGETAIPFAYQAAVDLLLAVVVFLRPWTLRKAWVLRFVSVLWLLIGVPFVLLSSVGYALDEIPDGQPLYLGVSFSLLLVAGVLSGPLLLWLATLGGVGRERSSERPGAELRLPIDHLRRHVNLGRVAAMAALVASILPIWPLAGMATTFWLGGCAPAWLVASDPVFCVTSSVQGRTLVISGQTTLPDGSTVLVRTGDQSEDTSVTVRGGSFSFQSDISSGHAGPLLVAVQFVVAPLVDSDEGAVVGPSDQPKAVVDRYRSDGAGLTGPTAIWIPGTFFLNARQPFQELSVQFDISIPK